MLDAVLPPPPLVLDAGLLRVCRGRLLPPPGRAGLAHVATPPHTGSHSGNFLNSASPSSVPWERLHHSPQRRCGSEHSTAWVTKPPSGRPTPDPWWACLHPRRSSLHVMRTRKRLCPDLSSLRTRHRKLFCAWLFLVSVTFSCICLGHFQRKVTQDIHLH